MVLKEIGRCAAKEQSSEPKIGTSAAKRRSLPMSRFGFDEAVDLALAGGALLRFENVLEIDFQSVSGAIWVIMRHRKPRPRKVSNAWYQVSKLKLTSLPPGPRPVSR
jgi:hypothetical protein